MNDSLSGEGRRLLLLLREKIPPSLFYSRAFSMQVECNKLLTKEGGISLSVVPELYHSFNFFNPSGPGNVCRISIPVTGPTPLTYLASGISLYYYPVGIITSKK